MSKCKITYDQNGNKIGVSQNNELFQEILNNPQIKNFDEALSVFLETYSGEFELNANNINGFYSNAEQSLLNLKDKNPKNVKGWISQLTDTQKNGGIKNVNQELEWIGLEDYLNEYVKENNPKAGNIPSSVVEDYIKSNQIEIVDVSKGVETEFVKALRELNDYQNSLLSKYGRDWRNKMTDDESDKQSTLESNQLNAPKDSRENNTSYDKYQLKGAERYREVLLTMPSSIDMEYEKELIKKYGDSNYYNMASLEERDRLYKGVYKSSHWDEANILAHVRLNEKTLPDGRRVLILNEIQADISQDLKKEQDKILERVDKEFDNFLDNLIRNNVIIEEC